MSHIDLGISSSNEFLTFVFVWFYRILLTIGSGVNFGVDDAKKICYYKMEYPERIEI